MMKSRFALYVSIVSASLALVIVVTVGITLWQSQSPRQTVRTIATATGVQIGGPFVLTNHNGQEVTEAAFSGSYMLIYFGYSFCPDVCPTELQNMAVAMDEMGKNAEKVTPIFITVDPARDTVAFIKDYVEAFHPKMVGLTGPQENIDKAARSYRVFYAKVDDESSTEYLMDHTSYVYLMGPDGKFVTMFGANTPPEEMAAAVAQDIKERS